MVIGIDKSSPDGAMDRAEGKALRSLDVERGVHCQQPQIYIIFLPCVS